MIFKQLFYCQPQLLNMSCVLKMKCWLYECWCNVHSSIVAFLTSILFVITWPFHQLKLRNLCHMVSLCFLGLLLSNARVQTATIICETCIAMFIWLFIPSCKITILRSSMLDSYSWSYCQYSHESCVTFYENRMLPGSGDHLK